jgi:adenylate kinase
VSRFVFLGPPGAGKGTQAKQLSELCQVPHISTGEILRDAVSQQTDLGKKAGFYMNSGELVPDDLILDLIRERLSSEDAAGGWILDGFPRNVDQAIFLESLLEEIDQPFECVVNLDVPDEVIVARLVRRGEEEGRTDDTEETIRNRLNVYRERTEPLIDFYRHRQKLVSIDGNQPIEVVTEELKKIVQS